MGAEMGAGTPRKVLYVCTHNAVRSPMAHAITKSLRLGVSSTSAGLYSFSPVDPLAVAAMREIGVDITDHRPQSVADLETAGEDLGGYDVIVALSAAAHEAAREAARHTTAPVEFWDLADPTAAEGPDERRLPAYRAVRDAIETQVRARFGATEAG